MLQPRKLLSHRRVGSGHRSKLGSGLRMARTVFVLSTCVTGLGMLASPSVTRADSIAHIFQASKSLLGQTAASSRKDSRQSSKPIVRGQSPANPPADPYSFRGNAELANRLSDSKSRAKDFLQKGRDALRSGDTLGAINWRQKAMSLGVEFGPSEYSPKDLEQELLRAGVSPVMLATPTARPDREAATPDKVPASAADRFGQPSATNSGPNAGPTDVPPNNVRRLPGTTNSAVGKARDNAGPPTKEEAMRLAAKARTALDRGDVNLAYQYAKQAQSLNIPEAAFVANDVRPSMVLMEVESAIQRRGGVRTASANEPIDSGNRTDFQKNSDASFAQDAGSGNKFPVSQGIYTPDSDRSKVSMARAQEPTRANRENSEASSDSRGLKLYQQGIKALEGRDTENALRLFSEAWRYESELDPGTRRQLQDKLIYLRAAQREAPSDSREPSQLEEISSNIQLVRSKLFREVSAEQDAAKKEAANDPDAAMKRLQDLKVRIQEAEVDQVSKKQLSALVDRSINELAGYITANRSQIDLDKRNNAILKDIEVSREKQLESQTKLAELTEKFNKLMDEGRFPEAEVIAKQAKELAPDNPVAENLVWKSSFARRYNSQMAMRTQRDQGFMDQLDAVQDSAHGIDDREPIQFDVKKWDALSKSRIKRFADDQKRMSPKEMQIRRELREKQIEVNFTNQPLGEVISSLIELTGINIYPDPQGIAAEGVSIDTPVTMQLRDPISLQSALNLILEPLRLTYVVKHEVLLITSNQMRGEVVYTKTYYVADLVTPIPNFKTDLDVGLPTAIQEAYRVLGYGGGPQWSGPNTNMVGTATTPRAASSNNVLAQVIDSGSPSDRLPSMTAASLARGGTPQGGLGGGVLADFTQLIDLITSTIEPDSWQQAGGNGDIRQFDTNLSLVVRQTQEIHEQIADLLEQLRRLQDLQVTIEVRFITLQDDFFERMGVDFDFNVEDHAPVRRSAQDTGPSTVVGLGPGGNFTQSGDIQFTQDSFGVAIPQFGGFNPANAANLGFAILSDIEVFFVLQAAQSDTRTNLLQAPKVTMFNGQLASVFDGSSRPFVTGLIPVVGDFAAAHQPVVSVVREGTSLSVQAVISADRRFVRLTLVPYFSQIGEVREFTFTGRRTSDTGTNVVDAAGNPTGTQDNVLNATEGTTIQLPTVASTTVSTTVSVPDGGTILLGGIKRLREGRRESGVPMLSKLPYINRLFRNVGIGRETQSLMLMVTPRIIIQEEEEERLGFKTP